MTGSLATTAKQNKCRPLQGLAAQPHHYLPALLANRALQRATCIMLWFEAAQSACSRFSQAPFTREVDLDWCATTV
eukprot:8182167-Karenia_brevis.AAC.1